MYESVLVNRVLSSAPCTVPPDGVDRVPGRMIHVELLFTARLLAWRRYVHPSRLMSGRDGKCRGTRSPARSFAKKSGGCVRRAVTTISIVIQLEVS